jgi:molybdate transport system permease protein
VFPLIGMITGAPWGNVLNVITSKSSLDALQLSLIASLSSTALALLFGFPLAWLLARGQFRGKVVLRGLVTLPMVLPPVVGGIALLLAYGRRGIIGEPLDKAFGISLPFTLAGVIVAESFVAMPFFVITAESGLRSMNRRLEDAARSLGAKRLTVFRRVTLPLIWPSLAAGLVLTWARALGEFGATILVTDPKLLLLDEPLAALDVSTKSDVRRLLRATLRQSSAANILVTHDLLDAVALGDRMIVIENGQIVQAGTPAAVTVRPRSKYVADLTGVNLLRGTGRGTTVDLDGGGQLICADSVTGPIFAVVAPAEVSVHRQEPDGTAGNLWRGPVGDIDLMGDRVRVRVDGTPAVTAEVPPSAVDELKLDEGGELWASVNPAAVTVYPS